MRPNTNKRKTPLVTNRTAGVQPKQLTLVDNHSSPKLTKTRHIFVSSTSFCQGVVSVVTYSSSVQTQSSGLWKRLLATCLFMFLGELTHTGPTSRPRGHQSSGRTGAVNLALLLVWSVLESSAQLNSYE